MGSHSACVLWGWISRIFTFQLGLFLCDKTICFCICFFQRFVFSIMAFVKCRRRGEGRAEWILVFFFYISCEGIGFDPPGVLVSAYTAVLWFKNVCRVFFWKVSGLLLLRDCMTGFMWAKVWRFFSNHFQTFLCVCYVHVTIINLWHYHSCFSLY